MKNPMKKIILMFVIGLFLLTIMPVANSISTPTVTTNTATGVEETNATLQGTLNNDGGIASWCRFQYGLTTSYGTTTANQTKTTGQTFSEGLFIPTSTEKNDGTVATFQGCWGGTAYVGQTFTIGTVDANKTVEITGAVINGYRTGTPNTIYVNISSVNATKYPVITNTLASATINANSWSTSATWHTITFTSPFFATQGTTYYLYWQVPIGSGVNTVYLAKENPGDYAGGGTVFSDNLPVDGWTRQLTRDLLFNMTYRAFVLTPGTLYHYRAVANNTNGTGYGADKTFLTKPVEPTSVTITNTGSGQQTISFTKGTGANVTRFHRKLGSYPTSIADGILCFNGSGNSFIIGGLTGGNNWYYRGWSFTTWDAKSQYSDTYAQGNKIVQTLPTVTTNATTLITAQGARMNGFLIDNGSAQTTTGFYWDTDSGFPYVHNNTYLIVANHTGYYIDFTLLSGTTYYHRSWARNNFGFTYGSEMTFTTATTPTGSFNATRIFAHYCDLNATILDDGQGTPNPYIIGCNARIQIVNATTYPDWNKAGNTTWGGYKTDGQKTYWNHTILPANIFVNDRPGMKYYYRLQLNNTYYRVNYTAKTFISQPEDLSIVSASPDYDDLTSRIKIWWSGGGANYHNKTIVRYSTTNYPATPADGILLLNGTEWDEWMLNWTAPTQFNSMIYLSVWRWSTWGGLSTYSNVSRAGVRTPVQYQTRVFVTNQSLVTPTTMRIWCTVKSGGLPCWIRAEYGLTTAYGTNTAYQTGVINGTYHFDLTGLTPGKLYYVRAKINNTATTNYSNSKIPIPYYVNTNTIDPETYWTGGYLPNYIFLYNRTIASRCVNTTFQPYAGNLNVIWVFNYTAGTWTQWTPGSGCVYAIRNELRILWMRLISNFTQTIKLSDWGFLTRPASPSNAQFDMLNNTAVNLSWTIGTGSNRSVVVMSHTHLPTSPTDGTVIYNGTGNYTHLTIVAGTPYYCTVYGWTTWTYNPTLSFYSANSTMLNWSFIGVNCYNESNPSQAITPFNVQFKDNTGLHTYTAMGVSNTFILNLTDIPIGTNILIKVWASGYQARLMYQTITNSTFYNLSFYLPPLQTNGTGGGTEDCTLRTHTNSINVSNPLVDATIPFTHALEDMIQVERYNGSADNLLRTAYNSINVTDPTNDVTINLTHSLDDMVSVEVYNTSIDRTLRTYTNTKSITSMTANVWVALTHTPESFISIQVWNTTLYGTYGGWYTVPSDKYTYVSGNNSVNISKTILNTHTLTITIASINYYYWGAGTYGTWQYVSASKYSFNSTAVIVNESALDSYSSMLRVVYYWVQTGSQGTWQFIPETWYSYNTTRVIINTSGMDDYTTMLRVTYYWMDCPGATVTTPLYYCRVVETIRTEFTEFDRPVENANVWFQTYINTTGIYVNISTLLSDGNGYVSVYLIPGNLYQVVITKTGYDLYRAEYQPPPPNQYGQTVEKLFRIARTGTTPPAINYTYLMQNITWSLEPLTIKNQGPITFWFNITSTDNKLEWYNMRVSYYNKTQRTWIQLFYQNDTNTGGGSITYTTPNITGDYKVDLWFKKTGFPAYQLFQEGSLHYTIIYLQAWLKGIPGFVWYLALIVIMIIVMGYCFTVLGTGIITGYIGLGIMAFGLILRPDLIVNGFSGWLIWTITFLMYTMGIFIWSRI